MSHIRIPFVKARQRCLAKDPQNVLMSRPMVRDTKRGNLTSVNKARKSNSEKRGESIHIRFTSDQKRFIDQAARNLGLDSSTFGRVAILKEAGWTAPKVENE